MWSGLQDPVSQVFVANIGEAHEDRTDGCGLTARLLCCGKDDLRSFFEDAGEVRAEGLVLYLRRQYYLSTTFTASSRLSCKNLTTSIYTKLIIFSNMHPDDSSVSVARMTMMIMVMVMLKDR